MQVQPRDFISWRQDGAQLQLCVPQVGVKAFTYRRVKDDFRDAADLADLLRMGRLPEAWIAPREVRELREITRYRRKLAGLRTSCKDQVHGVLAKLGVEVTCSDIFGKAGSAWLDGLRLPQPYAGKVTSLRQLAGELGGEIDMLGDVIKDLLAGHRGYQVIQQLPGSARCWPRSSWPRSATSPGSGPRPACAPGPA